MLYYSVLELYNLYYLKILFVLINFLFLDSGIAVKNSFRSDGKAELRAVLAELLHNERE